MGDLSITALYTSQVWAWAGLPCAGLYATRDAKRVFDVTNAVLGVMRRGTPLRYALVHRHAMIDELVRRWQPRRVVELAAGLSRRGAAVTEDPQVHYVEVDVPAVIAHKRTLLERTAEGRAVLARAGFALVAGDVETIELAPLTAGAPVVVIAEGLAMYLDAGARRRLFAKIARLGDVRFVFDLVPTDEEPPPGITGRVLEVAMKRFTGGRTFERDARTRSGVLAELRAAGFAEIEAIAAADVAAAWALPHADRVTPTVVFTACAARATRS
jgi:O-methyltransferase involved in polyketide biosynthesis